MPKAPRKIFNWVYENSGDFCVVSAPPPPPPRVGGNRRPWGAGYGGGDWTALILDSQRFLKCLGCLRRHFQPLFNLSWKCAFWQKWFTEYPTRPLYKQRLCPSKAIRRWFRYHFYTMDFGGAVCNWSNGPCVLCYILVLGSLMFILSVKEPQLPTMAFVACFAPWLSELYTMSWRRSTLVYTNSAKMAIGWPTG